MLFIIIVVLIALAAMTYYCDPTKNVFAPKCIVKTTTGLYCPGCGFQRACHALMHGHLIKAARYNIFLLIVAPYIIALVIERFVLNGKQQERAATILESKWMAYTYIGLYLIWFVVRNILKV